MSKKDEMTAAELAARHAEKMKVRKDLQDKKLADKTVEKGLLIVHTGTGKGKSTAAFGMAMRAVAHGMKVGIVQFIKGPWHSGERDILAKFPDQVEILAIGEGFTWETQDRERDIAVTRASWDKAKAMIADPAIRMVILDELNIALRYDYLPLDEVLAVIAARPAGQARHRHRPQCQARNDRGGRSRHRNDAGQAPVPGRREGAGGHRVLTGTWVRACQQLLRGAVGRANVQSRLVKRPGTLASRPRIS